MIYSKSFWGKHASVGLGGMDSNQSKKFLYLSHSLAKNCPTEDGLGNQRTISTSNSYMQSSQAGQLTLVHRFRGKPSKTPSYRSLPTDRSSPYSSKRSPLSCLRQEFQRSRDDFPFGVTSIVGHCYGFVLELKI
jgi:hypothetical protein